MMENECPEKNGEQGCPSWQQIVMTNNQTGEVVPRSDCVLNLMPMLMVEVIKASNRPAAEISALRNDIVEKVKEAVLVANSVTTLNNPQNRIDS